jgi:predicted methyltransferase
MRAPKMILAAAMAACLTTPYLALAAVSGPVAAVVADKARPDADTQRDAGRKPGETLDFAAIKPGSVVAELMPGGGYYTRLLSGVVGPKGKVFALTPAPAPRPAAMAGGGGPPGGGGAPGGAPGGGGRGGAGGAPGAAPGGGGPPGGGGAGGPPPNPLAALAADPHYSNVTLGVMPVTGNGLGLSEKVDVVWTSDNYHDMHNNKAIEDMKAFDKMVFDALKPGGVFIVVDHAAAPGHGANDTSSLHRIDPETVKAEVTSAGFKLAGSSDVLKNAQDDHTARVFDGSVRGTTDQFILKFVKP